MNYTTEYTILLTLLYTLIIAIKYSPNCNNAAQPIKYFINLEDFKIEDLSYEQLRKLAKKHKIVGYSKMSKANLLDNLSNLNFA